MHLMASTTYEPAICVCCHQSAEVPTKSLAPKYPRCAYCRMRCSIESNQYGLFIQHYDLNGANDVTTR